MVLSDIASRIIAYEFHIHAQIISKFREALAKPGRGNVFVAHATANRGQRGRWPSRICRVLQVHSPENNGVQQYKRIHRLNHNQQHPE